VTLPVTFVTRDRTEYIKFKVANFESIGSMPWRCERGVLQLLEEAARLLVGLGGGANVGQQTERGPRHGEQHSRLGDGVSVAARQGVRCRVQAS
jgi:hypothetical protein